MKNAICALRIQQQSIHFPIFQKKLLVWLQPGQCVQPCLIGDSSSSDWMVAGGGPLSVWCAEALTCSLTDHNGLNIFGFNNGGGSAVSCRGTRVTSVDALSHRNPDTFAEPLISKRYFTLCDKTFSTQLLKVRQWDMIYFTSRELVLIRYIYLTL